MSAWEHLEDVNIINANPIPLTAFGDGAGAASPGEMKYEKKQRSPHAQEVVVGGGFHGITETGTFSKQWHLLLFLLLLTVTNELVFSCVRFSCSHTPAGRFEGTRLQGEKMGPTYRRE